MDDLPDQLHKVAVEVRKLLEHLNAFHEFTDENLNESLLSFEKDLKASSFNDHVSRKLFELRFQYWSDSLNEYKGKFTTDTAVQRYVHDLSNDVGTQLELVADSVSDFTETGQCSIYCRVICLIGLQEFRPFELFRNEVHLTFRTCRQSPHFSPPVRLLSNAYQRFNIQSNLLRSDRHNFTVFGCRPHYDVE
jgi:hypothetical protein